MKLLWNCIEKVEILHLDELWESICEVEDDEKIIGYWKFVDIYGKKAPPQSESWQICQSCTWSWWPRLSSVSMSSVHINLVSYVQHLQNNVVFLLSSPNLCTCSFNFVCRNKLTYPLTKAQVHTEYKLSNLLY